MAHKKVQKQNVGNAGEYYVASLLSARNFITSITLGRAERYDILAVSPSGRTYKFSVKSRLSQEKSGFTLSKKDEKKPSDDFYYVFVRLHEFKAEPEYWVIPSKRVAEVISSSHRNFLKIPGREGQARNDSLLRKLPIVPRGSDKLLYPKDWEFEMKNYYKNFDLK